MGQSIGPPARSTPPGKVNHPQSGSLLAAEWRNGQMIHHLSEDGMHASYPIRYQIGAGKVGHSYLSVQAGFLLESPISYYTKFGWDISPGYRNTDMLDFNRVLDSRCLFCHSNAVSSSQGPAPGGASLSPIGCERCHGSANEHLRRPSAGTILNPAKLSVRARDSICEQCHLEGVARILNPLKTLRDFSPGQDLAETLAIYVIKNENSSSHVAVSQAEQLALSRCSRASSGKLWCGSCHDPHAAKQNSNAEIKAICSGCHPQLSPASHSSALTECVSCHMPRLTPKDIAHAATTDHRILAKPSAHETVLPPTPRRLQAWREPPSDFARRDLALAELQAAGTPGFEDLALSGAKALAEISPNLLPNDGAALAALASVKLSENQSADAVELFKRAEQADSSNAQFALYLGIAAKKAGHGDEAIRALRRSIQLNPSLEKAYLELASLYTQSGQPAAAALVLDNYLQWNKQSILGRITRDSLSSDPLPH